MTSHILPVYNRANVSFTHGEGPYLFAQDGTHYLDFAAGIAVNAFGHAHPALVEALHAQAQKVWHVSNIFRIPEGEKLAARLCAMAGMDRVFFTNSGMEAWECGIKIIRRYFTHINKPERTRVICFEGCFHGRGMTSIAASGTPKMVGGFGPLIDIFDSVPWDDLDAVARAITPATAAICIEPVQGEGGMRAASDQFLQGLRRLCDAHGLLLFYDEIQCGMGRTGKNFAWEWSGAAPDVMCIAKALGAGFPVGACLASEKAAAGMNVGSHGSTFGGNPLAMAVGTAVLDLMEKDGFLAHISRVGDYMWQRFDALVTDFPALFHTNAPPLFDAHRGKGLMQGLRCVKADDNLQLVAALRDKGLLCVAASDQVVRFLPPLIIDERHVDEAFDLIVAAVCDHLQPKDCVIS